MHDNFPLGSLIRSTVRETDIDLQPFDPADLTFILIDPEGGREEFEIGDLINVSPGVYYIQFPVDIDGQWFWRWEVIGSGKAGKEGSFTVKKSNIPEP